MKTKYFLLITVIFASCVLLSCSSNKGMICSDFPKNVQDLLDRTGLELCHADSFAVAKIETYKGYNYQYALKYPSNKVELRIIICPIDEDIAKYKSDVKKAAGDTSILNHLINPNDAFEAIFMAFLARVTEKRVHNIDQIAKMVDVFPKEIAKADFNADWGACITSKLASTAFELYQYYSTYMIYKKNLGYVICMWMLDKSYNEEEFDQLLKPLYYCVKFKAK